MALTTEHSFAQVPSPRREARACIERLAPRSSQELDAAAGAIRRGPEHPIDLSIFKVSTNSHWPRTA